jgi:hypothetical protein
MNHKPSPDNCPYCGTPMCELPCHTPSKDWDLELTKITNTYLKRTTAVNQLGLNLTLRNLISKTLASERTKLIDKLLERIKNFETIRVKGDHGDDEDETHPFINKNAVMNLLIELGLKDEK